MLLRLRSRDGIERIEINDGATVAELRQQIASSLGVDINDQTLSQDPRLLMTGSSPQDFTDMANGSATLSSLGIRHGSMIYLSYTGERQVARTVQVSTKPFGHKMTVEEMISKYIRIERQEKPWCESVSFDRNAANTFQAYISETLGFSIKRAGYMYGTVSEDSQVSVDFIYEPPQEGSPESVMLIPHQDEERYVDAIAAMLGLRKVGWIFSQVNGERDYTISSFELQQMAEMQSKGDKTFVSGVVNLQVDEESGTSSVHFEAFQVSDLCVKLWKDGVFEPPKSDDLKHSFTNKPVIIAKVGDTNKVDNDFFLVPVSILDHQGPLLSSFPVENRLLAQLGSALRDHMNRTRGKPYWERLSDFHLLLFLAKQLDVNADMPIIVDAVRTHGNVPEGYRLIIDTIASG